MSLIADALKRAQEQRATDGRDDRARRLLTRPTVRVATGRARLGRTVTAAGTAFAASVMVLAVVMIGAAHDMDIPGPAMGTTETWEPWETGGVGDLASAAVPSPTPPRGEAAPSPTSPRGEAAPPPTSPRGEAAPSPTPPRGEAAPSTSPRGEAAPSPAGSTFRMSIQAAGADAGELFGRGLAAQQRGDLESAASLYHQAVALRPDDPQLHNNLGTVYRAQDRPEEALSAFRAAVAADPRYAPAWSNLGMVLDALGRDHEAVEAFRSALRVDPSNLAARVNLANKYLDLGVGHEARRLLAEVLRAEPSLPEAHYGMGRALEAVGDTAGAARHYRLFLNLAGGRFPALEARVAEHVRGLEP